MRNKKEWRKKEKERGEGKGDEEMEERCVFDNKSFNISNPYSAAATLQIGTGYTMGIHLMVETDIKM